MKGIIMEVNRSEAVILSDDGLFTKIKNKNYTVGQTVIYSQNKKGRIAAFACAAAAAVVITCGGFAYYTPTTYVSLDVNPSIAFSLNMFSRVLDVQPVNDDAEAVLDKLQLKNKTIDEALAQTIDKLIDSGYITEEENGDIIIATSKSNEVTAQGLADRLEEKVLKIINKKGKIADVSAQAVGKERVKEAKAMGVTPGKLNLVEKLKESVENQEDINVNEWLHKPVKEINKSIKENQKINKNKDKSMSSTTSQSEKTQAYGKKDEENVQKEYKENKEAAEQSNVNATKYENKTQNTNANNGQNIKNNNKSNENSNLGNANNNNNNNDKNDDDDDLVTTTESLKKNQSELNSKGNGNSHSNKSNGKGK